VGMRNKCNLWLWNVCMLTTWTAVDMV
jgi:hypothetical protein